MNEEEVKTNEELLEEREKQALIELGKLKVDDDKRGKVVGEAKTLSEIRINYMKAEAEAANNQAKIAVEQRKLDIEADRAKTERKRARWDGAKAIIYLFGGLATGLGSYMLDPWFQKDQRFQRFGEKLHDFVMRK